jgi:hypothetical protein
MLSGEKISDARIYYPVVDVTVTTGNGLSRSPATTVEILDKLAAITVTEDNWRILAAELEYLDIPQKQDIISDWKNKFQSKENELSPELINALKNNPELLAAVQETLISEQQPLEEAIPDTMPLGIPTEQVQGMPIDIPSAPTLPI